jgi:hydrogenase maturation protease
MNLKPVEDIAEAVLYEGYMLYPYRPSSVKNQQRFNFGVLSPPSYCAHETGSESSWFQAECLLRATPETQITLKVRFLQLLQRNICRYSHSGFVEHVEELTVEERRYQPWQEAEERTFLCETVKPSEIANSSGMTFSFPPGSSTEELRDKNGILAGAIVRTWQSLDGSLELQMSPCAGDVIKLTARVANRSDFNPTGHSEPIREAALLSSLVSAHLILGVEGGEFYSLLEPPPELAEIARSCENIGVWPVLASADATTMLASPIILYDFPQIAPESAGNLFDSTEIDEILSLRILTLTDAEKAEIRQGDERARALLERTESIPPEQFRKLHGVLRGAHVLEQVSEADPQ